MKINFEQVKKRFDEYCKNPQAVHPKIHGVIIGMLETACGGKDNRYQFAAALDMKPHSSDWTDGQWWALYKMCKPDKVGGKWVSTNENFQAIVDCVMRNIAENPLQISFESGGVLKATNTKNPIRGRDKKKIIQELGFYND